MYCAMYVWTSFLTIFGYDIGRCRLVLTEPRRSALRFWSRCIDSILYVTLPGSWHTEFLS